MPFKLRRLLPLFAALLLTLLAVPGVHAQAPLAPSTAPYRLSPGDSFDIAFRFTPEFNQTVLIQPDGHATLLVAGDIRLAGLTLDEARAEILRLAAKKLVDPELTLTLKDFDKPHFYVAGEVVAPGRFELRTSTTVLQAIFAAGGQKETASMAHVVLFRRINADYSEVHKLSFGKLDYGRKPATDLILQPGDMILVPRDNLTRFGRIIKTLNLGVYFNPTSISLP